MDRMVSFRSWHQRTKGCDDKERTLLSYLLQTVVTDKPSEKLHASDDRDRIFALLGLVTDHDQLRIPIDYESTTAADVFANTSKAILGTGDLIILATRARPYPTKTHLPSWACDWTVNVCLPFGDNTYIGPPLSACGTSTANASFPPHPHQQILHIDGFVVSKVSKVSFAPSLDSCITPED